MTDRTETKTLLRVERMPSSQYGNPRFRLYFDDATSAPLQPNSGCAYGIENRENFAGPLEVHYNGRGHVTYVKPIPVNNAEAIARCTGAVAATCIVERRNEDGTLTVLHTETWQREATQ